MARWVSWSIVTHIDARRPHALWLVIALAVSQWPLRAWQRGLPFRAGDSMMAAVIIVTPSPPNQQQPSRIARRTGNGRRLIRDARANLRVYRPASCQRFARDRWRGRSADKASTHVVVLVA